MMIWNELPLPRLYRVAYRARVYFPSRALFLTMIFYSMALRVGACFFILFVFCFFVASLPGFQPVGFDDPCRTLHSRGRSLGLEGTDSHINRTKHHHEWLCKLYIRDDICLAVREDVHTNDHCYYFQWCCLALPLLGLNGWLEGLLEAADNFFSFCRAESTILMNMC